jgi:hypothetical protein
MKKIIFIIMITVNLIADSSLYLGIQSSYPSDGFSVKVDTGERVSFQAVFDPLGAERSVSFRGIYKFRRDMFYSIYGYGEVGYWNWDKGYYSDKREDTLGYGLGAGWEYDLRGLDASFIPLFVNFELNLHFFDNSDEYYYNEEELGLGFGVHYKF